MYDKILVPLDGSELAEVTLYYVQGLAGGLGASVTLVYVTTPGDLTSPQMYESYLEKTALRVKEAAEKRAAETGGGEIKVDYKVLKGNPAEEIVNYAEKAKIDLIAMSTQGKSGIKRWALGNVADKVVRATQRQVFLVRARGAQPDVHCDRIGKVLVPVDGSKESESILKYVIYLASKFKLEVTLFHMWAAEKTWYARRAALATAERMRKSKLAYVERLANILKNMGIEAKAIFKEVPLGNEAAEIIKLSKEGGFSLVVMASHGHSSVGHWVFGSNTNKVLYEGSSPLLLIRPTTRKK
jgi:nucleotide-binding universal stress UspA family protein